MSEPTDRERELAQELYHIANTAAYPSEEFGKLLARYREQMQSEFLVALRVCMDYRGNAAFIEEYLPGGCWHNQTRKRITELERAAQGTEGGT